MVLLAPRGVGQLPSLMSLALGTASLALLVALSATWGAFVRTIPSKKPERPPYDDKKLWQALVDLEEQLGQVRGPVADIESWRDDLTIAVANGISHVDRAENRVKSTVKRARAELQKHGLEWEGLEAEHNDLRSRDGEGSLPEPMQPVSAGVEPSLPTSILGVPGSFSPNDVLSLSPE